MRKIKRFNWLKANKIKLFTPYKGKSKFTISFNKNYREYIWKARKESVKLARKISLAKAAIILGYMNVSIGREAAYRFDMRSRCRYRKNGELFGANHEKA